jgi:hypothetical protein
MLIHASHVPILPHTQPAPERGPGHGLTYIFRMPFPDEITTSAIIISFSSSTYSHPLPPFFPLLCSSFLVSSILQTFNSYTIPLSSFSGLESSRLPAFLTLAHFLDLRLTMTSLI